MRIWSICVVVWAILSGSASPTPAQTDINEWQYGEINIHGTTLQQAAIAAHTKINSSSADKDYVPIFAMACVPGDPLHWQQQLIINEQFASRGFVTVWVSIDGEDSFSQSWVVTGDKKGLTLVGPADVARLDGAKKLKLQWNWGWSGLWLSETAEFDLGDSHTALFTLTKSCAIPMP